MLLRMSILDLLYSTVFSHFWHFVAICGRPSQSTYIQKLEILNGDSQKKAGIGMYKQYHRTGLPQVHPHWLLDPVGSCQGSPDPQHPWGQAMMDGMAHTRPPCS